MSAPRRCLSSTKVAVVDLGSVSIFIERSSENLREEGLILAQNLKLIAKQTQETDVSDDAEMKAMQEITKLTYGLITSGEAGIAGKVIMNVNKLEDKKIREMYLTLLCSLHLTDYLTRNEVFMIAACKQPNIMLTKEGLRFVKISDLGVGAVFGEQALVDDKAR